jgi:hypothetical protein
MWSLIDGYLMAGWGRIDWPHALLLMPCTFHVLPYVPQRLHFFQVALRFRQKIVVPRKSLVVIPPTTG